MNRNAASLAWVRALVRYCDEEQAVVEGHLGVLGDAPSNLTVLVELDGEAFHAVDAAVAPVRQGEVVFRFHVHQPDLWWPAPLGPQPLYQFGITLLSGEQMMDHQDLELGFPALRLHDGRLEGQGQAYPAGLMPGVIEHGTLLAPNGSIWRAPADRRTLVAADKAGVPLLLEVKPGETEKAVRMAAGRPSVVGYSLLEVPPAQQQALAQAIAALDATRPCVRQPW